MQYEIKKGTVCSKTLPSGETVSMGISEITIVVTYNQATVMIRLDKWFGHEASEEMEITLDDFIRRLDSNDWTVEDWHND